MKKLQISAPGRINLLGEHLDYNHGIVLPAAIDRYFEFDFQATESPSIEINALDLNESWDFEFSQLNALQVNGWRSYVKGVFMLLFEDDSSKHIPFDPASSSYVPSSFGGLKIHFRSTIPIGAGLSSSAALCCGLAFGLNEWFGLGKSRLELALLAQQTEHQFAGVKCGLMDQVASLFGKKGQLIAFDCLDHSIETFSLPLVGVQLFLLDSKVKHNLAESAYNERRAQLEAAWIKAKELFPSVESWRTIDEIQLNLLCAHLDLNTQKRLRYVVDEIARVACVQALAQDISVSGMNAKLSIEPYKELGKLINQTHKGLRDLYEVSCEEIDFLQANLLKQPEILGARMMGGGFGGCLLVLAQDSFDFNNLESLATAYHAQFGSIPALERIALVDGVRVL
jgi:galactokinase